MDIKVIIADDHAIMREGLKRLLEEKGIRVLESVCNGREAAKKAILLKPDVVIMDISMPDLNGVEATNQIKKYASDSKIIALSMHSSRHMVDKMFAAGACGYLLKESAFDELYDAIREVVHGNRYLTPVIARMCKNSHGSDGSGNDSCPQFYKISHKETEVLQLVAEGIKTKQIAVRLGISVKTVESHRRNIMKKLNIFSVAGLTKFAIKEGIVSME